jgi:DNA modification methylase
MEQLRLIDGCEGLNPNLWHGSFNGKESTLQQLSPYVGKLKSGMANVLINKYSQVGDIVLDPFSGSGVVPLESLLLDRIAFANDLSPYAYVLTKGKLEAPQNKYKAFCQAEEVIKTIKKESQEEKITTVPDWVREFFHPSTLKEILVAFRVLKEKNNYFLTACLLGILHHIRPGFLSYPASHLVPYLRKKKYPPENYPEMYSYRDVESRLLAKIERAYRRSMLPKNWNERKYKVWQHNSMELPIKGCYVDTIISSPPYFGALDYARDNRLRLWFLGCDDWKQLDESLTANAKVYLPQMESCLKEMYRVLKQSGYCVLVLGDVCREGKTRNTAEILAEIAIKIGFKINDIISDNIPDKRRSRRDTRTTKIERILVMNK